MSDSKIVPALNELVEINNDRIEGYRTAIKNTENSKLRFLFAESIATSEKNLSELIREVYGLGGAPEEGTKTMGKIFRAWMDFKATLSGNDDYSLLSCCEFGEDKAQQAYEQALKDETINSAQRYMVLAQKAALKADHDRIKSLRDSVE